MEDDSYVGTAAYKDTTAQKYIGNTGVGAERFADRMDEIAIWTRAFSAAEVNALYVNQSGNYAGTGTTFAFTPDVVGTYTVQYSQQDTNVAGTWSDAANAVVSAATSVQVIQGEVSQGLVDQNGNVVLQGFSYYLQGQRAQGN